MFGCHKQEQIIELKYPENLFLQLLLDVFGADSRTGALFRKPRLLDEASFSAAVDLWYFGCDPGNSYRVFLRFGG